jgi:acetyl-CoA acetyltransferase
MEGVKDFMDLRKVYVAGYSITDKGQSFETPWRKLLVKAFNGALENAGMKAGDIETGSVAYNERTLSEAALGTQVVDALGLPMTVPMTPVSHACAGGGIALYNVWNYIASGRYDIGAVLTIQCSDLFDTMEAMFQTGVSWTA